MKPTLYLETTIPSYLTSRPSRDLIIAGHQELTREWWEKHRERFEIFVSQFVVDEIRAGDSLAALSRLKAIRGIVLLEITNEVEWLAGQILDSGIIPPKAATDAAHIAIAAVHRVEFLMTWNCAHLANAFLEKTVLRICRQSGFECPAICTPEELMGK